VKCRLAFAFVLLVCFSLTSAAQVVPQRVRVSSGIESNLIRSKVAPEYPPLARQAHIQGTVVLKVEIDKAGDVQNVQLVSGHPMLAPAAIEAVKQWKYAPYLLNGTPMIVETSVQVNFTLANEPPSEVVGGDASSDRTPPEVTGGVIGAVPPSDTPASQLPRRIRVSRGVESGLLVKKVQPEYPPEAKDQHIQGTVVLQATFDTEGNVANLQLISGHPLLAPPAIEAAKQWKYRPYLLNNTPIQVETQIVVNFTLEP
jgi:TonB family protein